jgi:hypothetical protein
LCGRCRRGRRQAELLLLLLPVVLVRGGVQVGQRSHVADRRTGMMVMIDEGAEVVLLALDRRRSGSLLLDADEVVDKLLLVMLLLLLLLWLLLLRLLLVRWLLRLAVMKVLLVLRVLLIGCFNRVARVA